MIYWLMLLYILGAIPVYRIMEFLIPEVNPSLPESVNKIVLYIITIIWPIAAVYMIFSPLPDDDEPGNKEQVSELYPKNEGK